MISSSWRHNHPREWFTDIFGDLIADDWRTASINDVKRGIEIEEYINRNDVTEYIILDDDPDMLDHQFDRLVQPDYHNGIMYADMERIRELLGLNLVPFNFNLHTIITHPNMLALS